MVLHKFYIVIPDILNQLTTVVSPPVIVGVILLLLVLDLLDIFSDSSRNFDLIFRTLVIVAAGYLIISAGGIF